MTLKTIRKNSKLLSGYLSQARSIIRLDTSVECSANELLAAMEQHYDSMKITADLDAVGEVVTLYVEFASAFGFQVLVKDVETKADPFVSKMETASVVASSAKTIPTYPAPETARTSPFFLAQEQLDALLKAAPQLNQESLRKPVRNPEKKGAVLYREPGVGDVQAVLGLIELNDAEVGILTGLGSGKIYAFKHARLSDEKTRHLHISYLTYKLLCTLAAERLLGGEIAGPTLNFVSNKDLLLLLDYLKPMSLRYPVRNPGGSGLVYQAPSSSEFHALCNAAELNNFVISELLGISVRTIKRYRNEDFAIPFLVVVEVCNVALKQLEI